MPVAGGPNITKTGILLEVDSADKQSYPGSGTTWTNNARLGSNNGVLNNISFDSTDSKGALIFTGSNTFVDFGNLGPSLTSSFSFQVAFKPAATASGQPYTILSYASASATSSITFKLDYTSSNQTVVLTTFSNTGSQNIVYAISASAASGSWNIVHGTFGSGLAALYVNGLGQAYAPTTGSVVGYNTSNRLYAGASYGLDSGFYTGSMANVTVNNADLDGLTVNKNYNALATRFSLPVRRSVITDADAFNFVEAAGISGTQAEAINTLVLGLKANNLWTKMQAIYPFIGGTAYSHKFNLKNINTFTGIFIGGWTHSPTGVTPNGTNGYMNTQFVPSINFNGANASISIYSRTSGSRNSDFGRSITGGGTIIAYASIDGNIASWFGDTGFTQVSDPNNGLGLYNFQRTSTSNKNVFANATKTLNANTTFTGWPNLFIPIGAYFLNTSFSQSSGREFAFAHLGDALTDTEAVILYNLVQAYQTTLGRQI
jgi:hypothetical protein